MLIICAASERFSSGIALTFFCTAGTIHLFIKTFPGITRRAFAKDADKTAVSSRTRSLVCVAVVDFPILLCQCFVRGSRQTVGVVPLTTLKVSKDWWKWENLCFHTWEAVCLRLISAAQEDGISLPSICLLPSDPCTSPSKCLPQDCRGVKTSGALSYSAGLSSHQENPFNCLHWNMNFHWLTFTSLCFSNCRKAGLRILL